jgi:myo-inositol-1(or 4)-monophosphatase
LDKSRVWIVDPLDGTQEFVDRVEEFVVSVALVVEGAPVLGVLVHPTLGTELTGLVGEGAWRNGAPVRVTSRPTMDGARVLVSRTEMKKGWFRTLEGRAVLEPVGSVAWKLGLVGAGLADATFTPRPRNTWDLAGGAAIVTAAGGRCTDNAGHPYHMNGPSPLLNGVVISNGHLHGELLALSAELQAIT